MSELTERADRILERLNNSHDDLPAMENVAATIADLYVCLVALTEMVKELAEKAE